MPEYQINIPMGWHGSDLDYIRATAMRHLANTIAEHIVNDQPYMIRVVEEYPPRSDNPFLDQPQYKLRLTMNEIPTERPIIHQFPELPTMAHAPTKTNIFKRISAKLNGLKQKINLTK